MNSILVISTVVFINTVIQLLPDFHIPDYRIHRVV